MADPNNRPVPDEMIAAAADAIGASQRLVVLSGAGISKESGIPTFRDAQVGLWARYEPSELASPRAFRRDPGRVWDWYEHRRALLAGAQPNPGHIAIAELERLSNLIRVAQTRQLIGETTLILREESV